MKVVTEKNDNNNINYSLKYNIYSDSLLYPKSKHREQSKLIHQLLTKYHYKKTYLNDSLSEKILEKYISSLKVGIDYILRILILEISLWYQYTFCIRVRSVVRL